MATWQVVLLGLIEGITEFLPVSSTGHLILAGYFLGFKSPGKTFEVLIQLGAILAILTVYCAKIVRIVYDLPSDRRTQRFVAGVIVAFLPAALIGAVMHKQIKGMFEYPALVCVTLIVGGIILLVVEHMTKTARHTEIMDYPLGLCLAIGACQCLALVPGVSRSGATIVGAMMLGADKRSAAEFSFFLAMPTMAGAFAYDLYKNYGNLTPDNVQAIVLGFSVSFIAALFVVRYLLDFVSRNGFALFAWWRIVVGGLGLGALAVLG